MSRHVTKAERIELELKDIIQDVVYLTYDILENGVALFANETFWYTQNHERKDWNYRALMARREFLTDCTTVLFDKTLYHVKTNESIKTNKLYAYAYHMGFKNGNIKFYRLD